MTAKILGICGINCSECPAYLATQKNDDNERQRVAEMWSEEFNADIKPEHINCDGCIAESDVKFAHCAQCDIRSCGESKTVENCGHCDDYICERLNKFFGFVPAAKVNLDEVYKEFKK